MGEYNFFDYEIRDDDSSLKTVREQEEFFGFDESFPFTYSDDYFSLCDSIVDDDDIRRSFKFKYRPVS